MKHHALLIGSGDGVTHGGCWDSKKFGRGADADAYRRESHGESSVGGDRGVGVVWEEMASHDHKGGCFEGIGSAHRVERVAYVVGPCGHVDPCGA